MYNGFVKCAHLDLQLCPVRFRDILEQLEVVKLGFRIVKRN